MKRIFIFSFILLLVFSLSFTFAESMGWLSEELWTGTFGQLVFQPYGRFLLASLVILALALDLFLPVPSSFVMTAAGAWLGFGWGCAVNMVGLGFGALLAYELCRWGGEEWFLKLVGSEDVERLRRWLERHGVWAIVLSRSVPMLTEILSCLAGMGRLRRTLYYGAAVLGSFPYAVAAAWLGSVQSEMSLWVLLAVIVLPAVLALVLTRLKRF
jgi:uncharacterized membrane protein YdjX (TVP38/TMEM64 family)